MSQVMKTIIKFNGNLLIKNRITECEVVHEFHQPNV
jgi:hypothetical protein